MAMKDLVRLNGETNSPMRREASYPNTPWETTEWMDKWFDSFFSRALSLPSFWNHDPQSGSFVPAVNVVENEHCVQVTVELPGMDEKDIELTLHNNTLSIKGEKKSESEDKQEGYYRSERSYGAFHRSIPLPENLDPQKIEATFKKGVLHVNVPKLPESQTGAKKIAIKSEELNK